MKAKNLFHDIPAALDAELFTSLLEGPNIRIERIVSWGQKSDEGFWFDQDRHEWVVLLAGSALIEFAGDGPPLELRPGDYLHIPAHCRHRVLQTDPENRTVWLAVHYPENHN